MTGLAVLGSFVLDTLFGDPAWLPHPVVLMGKLPTGRFPHRFPHHWSAW